MPRVVILETERDASAAVASFLASTLGATPDLVIALPAGRTPVAMYEALVACHESGAADFSGVTTFGLDEFAGVRPADPRSFHAFHRRHLLDHVNVARDRIHTLNGAAADWRREVAAYEREISDLGGLDFAIVGIGRNGHVGFNEPADRLVARTHRVRLRPETRRANAEAFGGRSRDVPAYALSMGMGTILNARGVILLAFGRRKRSIVRRALAGPVTTRVPASLLQLHPNALVVLDRAAAGGLEVSRGARNKLPR
ncbi:MAG TPA: glucosamine-6-phosphate deaminase [Vicinamibacterales bacterium]|jgi:glucosamine-6-phosphate deaminase